MEEEIVMIRRWISSYGTLLKMTTNNICIKKSQPHVHRIIFRLVHIDRFLMKDLLQLTIIIF